MWLLSWGIASIKTNKIQKLISFVFLLNPNALLSLITCYWLLCKIYTWVRFYAIRNQNYRKEAELTQRKRDRTYVFDRIDRKILEAIQDMLDGQFQRKFTAKQIITVACDRAFRIGSRHNLTADECFEEALQIADDRDKELRE